MLPLPVGEGWGGGSKYEKPEFRFINNITHPLPFPLLPSHSKQVLALATRRLRVDAENPRADDDGDTGDFLPT